MTRYSSCIHRALVAAGLLCLVVSPAGALDPAYLGELPDPLRITRDFQGTDRLDTLALQVAALTRLNRLVTEMAGDRYYTPRKFPTPDETRVIAAIRAAATPLGAEAEATFDPKARGADTPRAQWRRKVAAYERSDELYARLMQLYFSPAFRDAHAVKLVAKSDAQSAARADLERGRRELAGEREPALVASHALELWIGVAALALLVLGSLKLLRVPTISVRAPYRFRVGLARHTIEATTGMIANYTHREVIGKQPVQIYDPGYVRQSRDVTMEAYEDFTLDEAGRSEPIHLAAFYPYAGLPVFVQNVGQRTTALWATIGRERRYLLFHGQRGPERHGAGKATLAQLFPRPTWTVVPALVLGFVVGDLVVATEFSGALAVFVALAVWGGLMKFLTWHRSGAFETRLEALGKRLHEAA